MINFETTPETYKHWKLSIDGAIATLTMDVQEDETLAEGYKLKLNSYDLGVDIELADAVSRLRFEHPGVRVVQVTSLKPRIFCAGANIYMLGTSAHGFKVNFCKFTNETRCSIEDASAHSGQRYVAALNGTASGGGYELAIACDEIYLVDDGNSAGASPDAPPRPRAAPTSCQSPATKSTSSTTATRPSRSRRCRSSACSPARAA